MSYLEWIPELDTNIPEVDLQHRRIVEYINELHDARIDGNREGGCRAGRNGRLHAFAFCL